MRDTIQDKKFFEERIKKTKNDIIESNKYLNMGVEKGDEKIIKTCSLVLSMEYRDLFTQYFSIGKDINEIYSCYKKWLDYYSKVISKNEYLPLYNLMDLFSIGICYEDRKEDFLSNLQAIIDEAQPFDDPTLEFYMQYLGIKQNKSKKSKSKINYLDRLLNSEDRVEALKNTMSNWYRFNRGAPWFGRHKGIHYDGYWAFDVCGLVKILGIDDDVVKDHKYYPYDLVHFNDKKNSLSRQ